MEPLLSIEGLETCLNLRSAVKLLDCLVSDNEEDKGFIEAAAAEGVKRPLCLLL